MGRRDGGNGFDFDDHGVLDHEVRAEGVLEVKPFEFERLPFLPLDMKPVSNQIAGQDLLVDRLDEPGPERGMDADRGIDDAPGDEVQLHQDLSAPPPLRVSASKYLMPAGSLP